MQGFLRCKSKSFVFVPVDRNPVMPLVYQQNINVHTKLGVWHIAEAEDFFLQKVPLQQTVTHPHKRLQHLAGRWLLRELYADFPLELIRIADTRKPFLESERYHFSISHCGDYAAVIVSSEQRVGIDIEIPQAKIERVKHKYLSDAEVALLGDHQPGTLQQNLTAGWSIKEALFKWYGGSGVNFKENMQIQHIRTDGNMLIAGCLFSKNKLWHPEVHAIIFGGNVLAWVVTEITRQDAG